MPKESAAPQASAALPAATDIMADDLIASCGGNPRAAVVALLDAVQRLERENGALRRAVSPGFARRTLPDSPTLLDPAWPV